MSTQEEHICVECYEVNKGYTEEEDEVKVCDECGGKVLDLQEAADYIAELKEQIRELEISYR